MKLVTLMALSLSMLLALHSQAWAKKKNKTASGTVPVTSSSLSEAEAKAKKRVESLSADDQRLWVALSDSQRKTVLKGVVSKDLLGFNEWMVKLALGEPFYATEHHPVFEDYEQVWLYTKPEVKETIEEKKFIDHQTNWPSIERKIERTICNIGDIFILWDRGVVVAIEKIKERKLHGSCSVEHSEAILPIVDGKPVEPKP